MLLEINFVCTQVTNLNAIECIGDEARYRVRSEHKVNTAQCKALDHHSSSCRLENYSKGIQQILLLNIHSIL